LQMINHAKRRAELDAPTVVLPEGSAEITVTAAWNPLTATVTDPAGHSSELTFQQVGTRMVGGFDRTVLPGYYRVEVQRGKANQAKHGSASFAVNLAAEESQLTWAREEEIRRWLPGASLQVVDASAEAQQQFGSVGEGTEMWRYLLAITFVIIAAEFMLSTYAGRPVKDKENRWGFHSLRHFRPGAWEDQWTEPAGKS